MSSEQSSSQNSFTVPKKKYKKVPVVMEPFAKVKTKLKQIIINLSMTKYQVITTVAEELQWKVQHNKKKNDWDILWTDYMIDPEVLIKMHFFQKISHFPGIHVLARKNLLGLSFMEMNKKYPHAYNFFPKTWMLPNDYPQFRQEVEKGSHTCYIVKPEADCQGKGIFLTFKTQNIQNGKHYVVQQYLQRPFLVDGLKFDFRVYVLLCGTNPMRLYMYNEGLARFATEAYAPPKRSNIKNKCMHLTNYAINKKSPKFIFNKSAKNMSEGHKRSLTSVFNHISSLGLNLNILKQKLYDTLVKTVILGQPLVSHQYKFAQPDDEDRNMCFHILGIDVMINQLMNPIILQVNHTPSFSTDTPLDYSIKHDLIKDTLILMNITTSRKKELVKKTNSYQRQRILNGKRLIQTQEQKQKIISAQKERDLYEDQHKGNYHKIYPVPDQSKMAQYEEYLKSSQKSYFSENNIIRSQIQSDKEKSNPVKKQKQSKQVSKETPKKVGLRMYRSDKKMQQRGNNYSTQIFRKNYNLSQSQQPSKSYFSINKKQKVYPTSKSRAMKSISEFDGRSEKKQSQLPKMCQSQKESPIKTQITELQKNHYISLRKKKIIENREVKKNQKNGDQKEIGNYLIPKVVLFDSYNEDEFIDMEKFEQLNLKNSLKGTSCGISRKVQ